MSTSKPKMTVSSVRGRIIVTAEDGERVGAWGGTECFLSRQTALGPCLVVRSSRHKRHEGTFFQLHRLQRVLSAYAVDGKLTVVVPHERRVCTVFIETTADIDALRLMAAVLQDRNHWKDMEKNVACRMSRHTRSVAAGAMIARKVDLRDPNMHSLQEWDDYEDDNADKTDNKEMAGEEEREVATYVKTSLLGMEEDDLTFTRGSVGSSSVAAAIPASSFGGTGEGIPGVTWTHEQMRATQLVRSGQSVFVTGAVGTGKTTWLRYIMESVLSRNADTVISASTAVAARRHNGCTINAFAGIERGDCRIEKALHRVKSHPELLRVWRDCKTLVIVDVEMLSGNVFVLLDAIARRVRNAMDKPFGGIQLILIGDFLRSSHATHTTNTLTETHTQNNNNNNNNNNNVGVWCFESAAWSELGFVAVEFRTNYRYAHDMTFATVLADIRRGCYTRRVQRTLSSWLSRPHTVRCGVEPAHIVADRHNAEAQNKRRFHRLIQRRQQQGENEEEFMHCYMSEDYASMPGADVDGEVALLPLLELCIGAQVVLLAPLPQAPQLCVGDCGVVVSFTAVGNGAIVPVVCFAHSGGEEVVVPPVCVRVCGADGSLCATRTQIPLRLAWALAVCDVRGLTLPLLHVDLSGNPHTSDNNNNNNCMSSADMYLALTCVREEKNISLSHLDPSGVFRADAKVLTLYEQLFPETWLRETEKDACSVDSQLVGQGRGAKRTHSVSPPTHNHTSSKSDTNDNNKNGSDGEIPWKRERLFDTQLEASIPLGAVITVRQDALQLLAAAGGAIPHLTQESDAAEDVVAWQAHTQTSSQRLLLLDDD